MAAGERRELLRVLAAILHLGNIALEAVSDVREAVSDVREADAGASSGPSDEIQTLALAGTPAEAKATNFSGEDMARIADGDAALEFAARLLALEAPALKIALCARTVRQESPEP